MTIDHDAIAALDEKLASQIGDDIQVIFNHEYLFKEARRTIRNLYDEVKRLRAERDEALERETIAANAAVGYLERAEKAEAERDRLRAVLIDHNDLLRSAMQICNRAIQHEEFRVLANWDAFHDRISVCLKRHHATSNDARAALKGDSDE